METHRSSSTVDRSGRPTVVPWHEIERHTAPAFTLAGASLLASLSVPIGLGAFTERSRLVGVVLAGLAVIAVAIGLLGLYSRADDPPRRLASVGAVSAVVAGTAGLVLLGLVGLRLGASLHPAVGIPVGMDLFTAIALAMAGGYGSGFLSFGVLGLRSGYPSGRTALLLAGGGFVLLVPVVGALLRLGLGVGQPGWVIFPALGLAAVDTVAVGISLRSRGWRRSGR